MKMSRNYSISFRTDKKFLYSSKGRVAKFFVACSKTFWEIEWQNILVDFGDQRFLEVWWQKSGGGLGWQNIFMGSKAKYLGVG